MVMLMWNRSYRKVLYRKHRHGWKETLKHLGMKLNTDNGVWYRQDWVSPGKRGQTCRRQEGKTVEFRLQPQAGFGQEQR